MLLTFRNSETQEIKALHRSRGVLSYLRSPNDKLVTSMNSDISIKELYKQLFNKDIRVIGWGTGSVFSYYNEVMPLDLAYLVDNNSDKWGSQVGGYDVWGPEQLLNEDPESTVVVVYSSFAGEIIRQIKSMNTLQAAPVSLLFGCNEYEYSTWRMAKVLKAPPPPCREPKTRRAIVIQGPVVSQEHLDTVRYYCYAYPNETVILSTWADTADSYKAELEGLVDYCIFNEAPEHAGFQNRNYQIVSTREGVEKAQAVGAEKVLKVRTDLVVLSDGVLDACAHLQSLYPVTNYVKNRIIVPETYTRKYMLYHPSDLVMFGDVDDMINYWSVTLDEREFTLSDEDWKLKDIKQISIDGGPAESYLGRNFAKRIGWEIKDNLQDSWSFYRDIFVVVDNEWFDLFWYKYPRMPRVQTTISVHDCLSYYFWQRLCFKSVDMNCLASEIDINNTLWDGFYEGLAKSRKELVNL